MLLSSLPLLTQAAQKKSSVHNRPGNVNRVSSSLHFGHSELDQFKQSFVQTEMGSRLLKAKRQHFLAPLLLEAMTREMEKMSPGDCISNRSLIKGLLRRGANPNARDENGIPVINYAIASNKASLQELLRQFGAKEAPPEAIQQTQNNLFLLLQEIQQTQNDLLLLSEAMQQTQNDLVFLPEEIQQIQKDLFLLSKEIQKVQNNLFEKFKEALQTSGLNVNVRGIKGQTPLHCSAGSGGSVIPSLLLQMPGTQVNTQDDEGRTPLHWAVGYGNIEMLALLCERPDINVNVQDKDGKTPLHWAIEKRNIAMIEQLLQNSELQLNLRDRSGKTPLHQASLLGDSESVALLLNDSRTDVNRRDFRGRTALHLAAGRGLAQIVTQLLQNPKTKPFLTDYDTQTALDCAKFKGHKETACLFYDLKESRGSSQGNLQKVINWFFSGDYQYYFDGI